MIDADGVHRCSTCGVPLQRVGSAYACPIEAVIRPWRPTWGQDTTPAMGTVKRTLPPAGLPLGGIQFKVR